MNHTNDPSIMTVEVGWNCGKVKAIGKNVCGSVIICINSCDQDFREGLLNVCHIQSLTLQLHL